MAQKSKINKGMRAVKKNKKADPDKIKKIKKAVSEGTYKIDPEELAEKIIQLHLRHK